MSSSIASEKGLAAMGDLPRCLVRVGGGSQSGHPVGGWEERGRFEYDQSGPPKSVGSPVASRRSAGIGDRHEGEVDERAGWSSGHGDQTVVTAGPCSEGSWFATERAVGRQLPAYVSATGTGSGVHPTP